jgi:ABC-type phosphate transport system substrate-binding protein
MKNVSILAAFLTVFSGVVFAQEVYVGNAKFVLPVVERWVLEYTKEYPQSKISINTGNPSEEDAAVLSVIAGQPANSNNNKVVYLGKYALVPISNTKNPLLQKVGKGLKKKDLVKLLFERAIEDDDEFYEKKEKEKYTATVYSRKGEVATSITLANAFNASIDRIRGKKIVGDDIYLVNAVQKDENGVAFNTLNYVYDLQSRQLKAGLTILPINTNSKYEESIKSHNIDRLISLLEEEEVEQIPVGRFGLQVPVSLLQKNEVRHFLQWVLANSSKFNNELGFLNLKENEFAEQQIRLEPNSQLTYNISQQ